MDSSPPPMTPEKLPFSEAEKIILRWDSTASEEAREKMIFDGDRHEVDRYLQAVDEIQRSISSTSLSDEQNKVNSAVQIAMARLEDEFRNILISHTIPIEADSITEQEQEQQPPSSSSSSSSPIHHEVANDSNYVNDEANKLFRFNSEGTGSSVSVNSSYRSTSSIREIDLIPSEVVCDLRCIAERMISSGYLRECIQVYGSVRKSAVDASFRKLGIEKLSIGDVQRLEWEQLETKIRRWIKAAKVCVRTLFASEKKLCEQIFDGVGTCIDDACFMETVKGPAIQLFNFAEAISISRRSPEKLFKILDLHDALMDLIPDIDLVFDSKSSDSIRVQAAEILSRLAEAARGILSEFENAVLREPSKVPVPGGTIHPLTRYFNLDDSQLREELRISISEKLIPAYRSFLGRFRCHIESGKHPENYIKYSVEDLEDAVLDFFEGIPVSQHLRRRSN
ncbi:putative exocyst complex component Exo70, cullin repeat-like-containing domain-containing protein [Lupinus albus]|uniref:Exocyst subunit Exo70 family protein n=1 Tax=Lupinus albus TaxID=3870 RepID=A0A6A4PWH7_LUPAL|nr:putative exocyst complex component Exo70, cullin repeat-like-containing domain-containing protein [Lupinus albus]